MTKHVVTPLLDRLLSHVQFADEGDGCWLWTGAQFPTGYGNINLGRRGEGYRVAHRVTYELLVGPIPAGLELDHLCRVPACVRPEHLEPVTEHLEPVTHAENGRRGLRGRLRQRPTSCRNGHPYELGREGKRGTKVHDWIANGGPMPKGVEPWCMAAQDWMEDRVTPVAAELVVCACELGWSGQVDMVAEVDGVLSIIDWKTTDSPEPVVYPEHRLQVAAYLACSDGWPGEAPERAAVVVLSPNGAKEEWIDRYDAGLDTFSALLDVATWMETAR